MSPSSADGSGMRLLLLVLSLLSAYAGELMMAGEGKEAQGLPVPADDQHVRDPELTQIQHLKVVQPEIRGRLWAA